MKKILIMLLITGAFAACGDSGTRERINSEPLPDSTNNLPMTPDTTNIITDSAGGRNNPNSNQDSLRYN